MIAILLDHFVSEAPLFAGGSGNGIAVPPEDQAVVEERAEDAEVIAAINELLETPRCVRPVAGDGGDIAYRRFPRRGGLSDPAGLVLGLPRRATATLKHGIEGLLKHYVPESRLKSGPPEIHNHTDVGFPMTTQFHDHVLSGRGARATVYAKRAVTTTGSDKAVSAATNSSMPSGT